MMIVTLCYMLRRPLLAKIREVFSERCGGTTDPMLDFLIKVCCQIQMAATGSARHSPVVLHTPPSPLSDTTGWSKSTLGLRKNILSLIEEVIQKSASEDLPCYGKE